MIDASVSKIIFSTRGTSVYYSNIHLWKLSTRGSVACLTQVLAYDDSLAIRLYPRCSKVSVNGTMGLLT